MRPTLVEFSLRERYQATNNLLTTTESKGTTEFASWIVLPCDRAYATITEKTVTVKTGPKTLGIIYMSAMNTWNCRHRELINARCLSLAGRPVTKSTGMTI